MWIWSLCSLWSQYLTVFSQPHSPWMETLKALCAPPRTGLQEEWGKRREGSQGRYDRSGDICRDEFKIRIAWPALAAQILLPEEESNVLTRKSLSLISASDAALTHCCSYHNCPQHDYSCCCGLFELSLLFFKTHPPPKLRSISFMGLPGFPVYLFSVELHFGAKESGEKQCRGAWSLQSFVLPI